MTPRLVNKGSGRYKTIIFIIGITLIFLLLIYTQSIVQKLREQSRASVEFYANLYSRAVAEENVEYLNFILEQIVHKASLPLILTDRQKNPIDWKGIDVPPQDHSDESMKRVNHIINKLGKEFEPIAVMNPFPDSGDPILNYLYYGDSNLITQLLWLPYIEVLVVGLFILISYIGFQGMSKSEQQLLWVGMSKETAHQLGTPLSSMMGWLELLREDLSEKNIQAILPEMQNDIQRLYKVTSRFSQIGSRTELKKQNIIPVISGVINYFKKRLPQMDKQVRLLESYEDIADVRLNKDLFEWVLENLLKNALDSIEKNIGTIGVTVGLSEDHSKRVFIDVWDNGKGIAMKERRLVFKPGYSTKKRGWGLGLNLSKRIIEDYHFGKLYIKDSKVGEGTCMRILLKNI
ncbi:HAMP domain-containing histidine kinase [bacterium]|nr:HAMP domain-containing histidine kinase [candidate division CSSED10-310 bacterium]